MVRHPYLCWTLPLLLFLCYAYPLFQALLTLLFLLPFPTLPPGFLLGDLASQTPLEVPEQESLPRIIFNGFLGCSPG